jgi:hypothetical protein
MVKRGIKPDTVTMRILLKTILLFSSANVAAISGMPVGQPAPGVSKEQCLDAMEAHGLTWLCLPHFVALMELVGAQSRVEWYSHADKVLQVRAVACATGMAVCVCVCVCVYVCLCVCVCVCVCVEPPRSI